MGLLLTLWPIATSLMQMKFSFQLFSVQYEFGFWNEKVLRVKWGYFKSHDSQIVPKCEFWKRGITIQIDILQVLLNILLISLLSWVHDAPGYFEMQKE